VRTRARAREREESEEGDGARCSSSCCILREERIIVGANAADLAFDALDRALRECMRTLTKTCANINDIQPTQRASTLFIRRPNYHPETRAEGGSFVSRRISRGLSAIDYYNPSEIPLQQLVTETRQIQRSCRSAASIYASCSSASILSGVEEFPPFPSPTFLPFDSRIEIGDAKTWQQETFHCILRLFHRNSRLSPTWEACSRFSSLSEHERVDVEDVETFRRNPSIGL